MIEQCYVMIKPGFAQPDIIKNVKDELTKSNLKIIDSNYKKYTPVEAAVHYRDKISKPYFDELIDYLSSDVTYGIVITGENAIKIAREKVESLRESLPKLFNLKTDKMRNVLHCTNYKIIDDRLVDLDSTTEIAVFRRQ